MKEMTEEEIEAKVAAVLALPEVQECPSPDLLAIVVEVVLRIQNILRAQAPENAPPKGIRATKVRAKE